MSHNDTHQSANSGSDEPMTAGEMSELLARDPDLPVYIGSGRKFAITDPGGLFVTKVIRNGVPFARQTHKRGTHRMEMTVVAPRLECAHLTLSERQGEDAFLITTANPPHVKDALDALDRHIATRCPDNSRVGDWWYGGAHRCAITWFACRRWLRRFL